MPSLARRRGRVAVRALPAAFACLLAAAAPAAAAELTFEPALYPVGERPQAVAAGDVTGDGRPDVLAASTGSRDLTVLRADADGRLAAVQRLAAGRQPVAVRLGDVNGDGRLDGVVADTGARGLITFLGGGAGGLASGPLETYPPTPYRFALGEIDGDGRTDALVPSYESGQVGLAIGQPDGRLPVSLGLPATLPADVAIADLDGDGRNDAAYAEGGLAQRVTVRRGTGVPTWGPAVSVAMPGAATRVAAGDVTGDGAPDLVAATAERLWLLRGDGHGGFAAPEPVGAVGGEGVQDVVLADLDGDGRRDVAATDAHEVHVFVNGGAAGFSPRRFASGADRPRGLAAADFDGDGRTDLVVGNEGPATAADPDHPDPVTVLRNTAPAAPADVTPPGIDIASPAAGAVVTLGAPLLAAFSCTDDVELASCAGSVADGAALPTDAVGEHALTVEAADAAGNTASATRSYRVVWPFSGFAAPLPTLNAVQAGRAVPLKFSLGGDRGLDVVSDGYPRSETVACDSTAEVEGIEETAAPGESGLSFDGERYQYVWKTADAWSGTCRQLVLRLRDGSVHRATFKFR